MESEKEKDNEQGENYKKDKKNTTEREEKFINWVYFSILLKCI